MGPQPKKARRLADAQNFPDTPRPDQGGGADRRNAGGQGRGDGQRHIPLGSGNGALRLTTARYFTPSGRSIQAKGISPDIEVLQEVPEELKTRTDTKGEASLRGHLRAEGDEQTGSQAYIPPDPKDDKALHTALDLIRGIQKNSAYPPNPKAAVPN
jgi:carboxyl-terminal processing protease